MEALLTVGHSLTLLRLYFATKLLLKSVFEILIIFGGQIMDHNDKVGDT